MKRNGGYTFIEMLVAMTILIIGIVFIMRMLPAALRAAHMAGERSVAAQFAGSQLGMTRAAGAEVIQLDDTSFPLSQRSVFSAASGIYDIYSMYTGWQSDLQRMDGAAETYLQRVVFSVEMPDGRRESFVTYVTRQ
jgi:type II secretory pathway pseudopilin PulG